MVALSTCFFSIAILNEAVKQLRVTYQEEAIGLTRAKSNVAPNPVEDEDTEPLISSNVGLSLTRLKIFDGLLFSVQMILSYLLMLVVMSYSVWLFLAIVMGQAIGSCLFLQRPTLHLQQRFGPPEIVPCRQRIAEPNVSEEADVAIVEIHS